MVCWFAAGLVTGLYPALLSARQRMDLANGSAFVNQFLATLLPIPFLATGWGVTAFPAAQWIAGLSAFALSYLWVSRILPRFQFRASAFRLGDLKSLLGFSIYNWIGKIAFLLTNAVDNLLVAAWLGAPAVTSFLLSSKLSAMVAPNMARLAASSMPGFAELYATGDTARRQASALVLHRLAARVALFGSALVLAVNHRFVASWVSESRYAGTTFTVLLAALCLRDTLIKGTGVIIIASGQMKGFGLVTLAEAMGKIGLAYLFMKRMSLGLNGLLLAQLIPSLLLSTLYFPAKILHLTGLRPGRLLTQGLGMPFLRSLPSLAGLTLAAQLIPYHWGWLGIVLIAGVGTALNVSAFELPTFLRASGMPLGSRLRASLQVNF